MAVDVYDAPAIRYTGGEYRDVEFKYRLLKPAAVEAGKRYPVVLFLHGAGERGDDNKSQLKYLPEWLAAAERREKFPCFVIAPQCPSERKWSDVDWGTRKSPEFKDKPTDAMQVAINILDEVVKKFPVDAKRQYLTGLSMGGYGTWDLAMRQPDRFAAIAPICGGGDPTQGAKIKHLPIWAWHGDADFAVPVERSREMIAALEKAGGKPKYSELKGVGHDSWTAAYTSKDNLLPWLFEQAKK